MSFKCTTPRISPLRTTTSGVPPPFAMVSTTLFKSGGIDFPCCLTYARTESTAPFLIFKPSASIPLIRVCAVNGTKWRCGPPSIVPFNPYFSFAKRTILRPSGVSSASDASWAASASSGAVAFPTGINATACLFPRVIVPVLSSSSTSTSPAASTARPDIAITFFLISRSIPAMPIAGKRPPIVVGIRHTSSATSTVTLMAFPLPVTLTI